MWRRLVEEYDDPGLSVQSALKKLRTLKPVADKDYSGMSKIKNPSEPTNISMSKRQLKRGQISFTQMTTRGLKLDVKY